MRVVLDTNVLVAALRSRLGASYQLVSRVGGKAPEIALSVPLVLEYEAVLLRYRAELGLKSDEIRTVLDYLCSVAHHQKVHFLWRPQLRDPGDEMVLELAVNASCSHIVTFNHRDFGPATGFGVMVVTPAELLKTLGKNE